MTIEIKNPGLLTTIQDIGRYGYQKYGVIVSGAMDSLSLRIANLLVGNDEHEATLEITLYGTTIKFNQDHLIAITGGNLQPTLDNEPIFMWRPIFVRKGSILKFNGAKSGCRAYVSIAGGFLIPTQLGSKSTYLKAHIGGFKGRALKKGDTIKCGNRSDTAQTLIERMPNAKHYFPWSVIYHAWFSFYKTETIRILKGSEYERFDEASKQKLVNNPYTISPQADRMGYQLKGEKLCLTKHFELLSEAVTYGTIQVPADGMPIILMADRQTTGGYPKIAQVISADLPKLAQMQPHQKIIFKIVSQKKAERELLIQEEKLKQLTIGIQTKVL